MDKVIHTILETGVSLGPKFSREGIRKKQTDWRVKSWATLPAWNNFWQWEVGSENRGPGMEVPLEGLCSLAVGEGKETVRSDVNKALVFERTIFSQSLKLLWQLKSVQIYCWKYIFKEEFHSDIFYCVSWRRMGCLIMVLVSNFQL